MADALKICIVSHAIEFVYVTIFKGFLLFFLYYSESWLGCMKAVIEHV